MSACLICTKANDEFSYSKHNAINLISKLNSFTIKQLKQIDRNFIHDQILLTEMGYLGHHVDSEENIFEEFGKRVKTINKLALNEILNWLPQQWNEQTNDKFMSSLKKIKPKKSFFGFLF